MVSRWTGAGLVACVLSGFCLPTVANTTGVGSGRAVAQTDLSVPRAYQPPAEFAPARVALLVPLSSESLAEAAGAVRAGFEAAYALEPDGIEIDIVDSGDAAQDVVTRYQEVSQAHDIVVGPLSRSGVTALAQGGVVAKPTIALTAPDSTPDAPLTLPRQLLVMGLSIEDEARQAADWAAKENPGKKALVFYASAAWQRRAAKAFEARWREKGRDLDVVEVASVDGFLNGRALLQLKKDLQAQAPSVMFAALDARQARQVHAIFGKDFILYGTSQLNPVTLAERDSAERVLDMDGTRLLDIPWQLEPDHPAVMVYPKLSAEQKPSPDMERLYALGIDAFRVARQISLQRDSFELDGVTGKLAVQFGGGSNPHFERIVEHAVYRGGSVVATTNAR